jgi:hypothetical protein
MGTYEGSTGVTADPDELFAYLADVHNLPDYFASMREAEPAGEAEGDAPDDSIAVHTVADVDGTRREGEAWFTTDADARTLRWGSEGPSHYGGELRVDADGDVASTVTVRLHTEHVEGERIQEGLESTLAQIKENVEGQGRANPS